MSNGIHFTLDGVGLYRNKMNAMMKPPVVMNQEPIFSWYRSQKNVFFLFLYWTSDGSLLFEHILYQNGYLSCLLNSIAHNHEPHYHKRLNLLLM